MFDNLYAIYRFLKECRYDQQYIKIRKEVIDTITITYDDELYSEDSKRYHKYVDHKDINNIDHIDNNNNESIDNDYVDIDYTRSTSNIGSDYSIV